MGRARVTGERMALAFAVGSAVYFWYQFYALQQLETSVQTTLANVGVTGLFTPGADTVQMQHQAPYIAGAAAVATLLLI